MRTVTCPDCGEVFEAPTLFAANAAYEAHLPCEPED